ncbi:MAG: response regulator [Nanoarchaeota archaeon]
MAKDESEEIIGKIMQFLEQNPQGAHTSEIADNVGHNRITVGKYLDILHAQGKVDIRKIGQAKVFLPIKGEPLPKVLLVDDEEHVTNLIALTLGDQEYDISIAHDGVQALEHVSKVRPDIIILDLMMPNMNGYEVCQKLKENVLTQHIPIIILSAKSQMTDRIKGIKIGADDYMVKPFDPLELEARVKSMLQKEQRYKNMHPLTRFPDVAETAKKLGEWKRKHSEAGLAVVGLHNMDEYFSVCGYKSGGEGIALLAKVIADTVKEKGGIDDFIGHQDYAEIVIGSTAIDDIVKAVKDKTAKMLPYLYSGYEIKDGKVEYKGEQIQTLALDVRVEH